MNEKIFQKMYDELEKFIPQKWDRLVVYLEYGNGSYSFSFFVKQGKQYVKCYDLPGVNEDDLMKSFKSIDKIVNKERKSAKDLWTNMTMVIEPSGSMHTDFDYTDLTEGSYAYKKAWKAKYLI